MPNQVVQNLDMKQMQGTWFIQIMDKDGYHGYNPECHQSLWYEPQGDKAYALVTEFQDDVLNGF